MGILLNIEHPNNRQCHKVHSDPNHHTAYFGNQLYNVIILKMITKHIV